MLYRSLATAARASLRCSCKVAEYAGSTSARLRATPSGFRAFATSPFPFSSSTSSTFSSVAALPISAKRRRVILGIETSCDDSCASVVCSDRAILSSIVTKQDHSSTGGIHPLSAALGHHVNLPATIAKALEVANVKAEDLDAVAVTQGPGMASSLGVGLAAAKTLSAVLGKPLIYVHHMQAHALTPLLTEKEPPSFPFLVLLVSGGHTMLVLATSVVDFEILATTKDDSIGDAFDKVARDLGIPWTSAPGAALEALAAEHISSELIALPVPLRGQPQFSYSGLKAAVTRYIDSNPSASHSAIAASFQAAATAQLQDKLSMVLRPWHDLEDPKHRPWPRIQLPAGVTGDTIKTLVCSGGVASNKFIRTHLRSHLDAIARQDVELQFPPLELCTDNAAMIAWVAHLIWDQRTTNDYSRHARSKWSLEDIPRGPSSS